MNLLCLDQFGELGGAQRCLLDLVPAMISRGWAVHIAAPGNGQLAGEAPALGASFDTIRCGPYSSGTKTPADISHFAAELPRLAAEIRGLVWRYDPDLIYVNGPRVLPAAAWVARKGPRVLFHSHSLLGGYARRLAGWSAELARAVLVASCRFVAAPLLAHAGERGVRVVYNGVRRFAMPPRVRTPEFRIGVIGRISPEKGQADFLHAARILNSAVSRCRFVICGAPLFSSEAAMRYCAQLETLADGIPVDFMGWKEDVAEVLAGLDLLVVPSTWVDATPRVILEAFAAGVPVLAFASGGIPEIVEDGVNGFLVEERSPKALALAMLNALESPARLADVADQARTRARGEFSLERYQAQMMEVLLAAAHQPATS